MAEFTYNAIQLVEDGADVLLNNTSCGCGNSFIYHQNETGIVTLGGPRGPYSNNFARYVVEFNGNIAVPDGQTVGEISVAIEQNGVPIQVSRACVTPTAVDQYFHVTSRAVITIPRICGCMGIAVENVSGIPINVQNAGLTVTRVA